MTPLLSQVLIITTAPCSLLGLWLLGHSRVCLTSDKIYISNSSSLITVGKMKMLIHHPSPMLFVEDTWLFSEWLSRMCEKWEQLQPEVWLWSGLRFLYAAAQFSVRLANDWGRITMQTRERPQHQSGGLGSAFFPVIGHRNFKEYECDPWYDLQSTMYDVTCCSGRYWIYVVPSPGCKMLFSWFGRAILLPVRPSPVFSAAEAVRRPAAAANEGKYCSHSFFLCLYSQKGSYSIIYSYQYSQPCKRPPPGRVDRDETRPLVARPVFCSARWAECRMCWGLLRWCGAWRRLVIIFIDSPAQLVVFLLSLIMNFMNKKSWSNSQSWDSSLLWKQNRENT